MKRDKMYSRSKKKKKKGTPPIYYKLSYRNETGTNHHRLLSTPVAEFSVSVCSTPKFICSSDEGVPRLLNTENDASCKSNIYRNRRV